MTTTLTAESNRSLKTPDPDEFEDYLHTQASDDFDEYDGLDQEPDPEPNSEPDFEFDADASSSEPAKPVATAGADFDDPDFEPAIAPSDTNFDEPDFESDFAPAIAPSAVNFAPDPEANKFAQYTGYTPGTEELEPPAIVETSTDVNDDATNAQGLKAPVDDETDIDEDEVVDPRSAKTKVGFTGSPLTRIALVGGGCLLAFGALGVFLSSVTGGKSQQAVVVPIPSPTADARVDPHQLPSKKEGQYMTETALAGQRQALGGKGQLASTSTSTPSSTSKPTAANLPSPTPVAISSIPMALPASASLLSPMSIDRGQTKTDDPIEKWRTIASMGSYGQVPVSSSNSYSTPATVPATVPIAPLFTPTPVMPTTTASGATSIRQLRSGSSVPGLRDRPVAMVLTGASAAGQLTTGVVLSGDNTTAINPDSPTATKYLVTLKAPLKDANGEEALPSGSSLVLTAKSFSPQSGLAEFQLTSVIVSNKEYALPTGSIVVRGENGAPLTLAKRSNGGGGLFQAVLPAFFAGVSQAGQILNQPTSSATVNGGSVSATTSSSNPSPLAGFAQGFGQNISQSLQQKATAANQSQASQPNTWALNAGTPVMVFVNSSFEM